MRVTVLKKIHPSTSDENLCQVVELKETNKIADVHIWFNPFMPRRDLADEI